MSGQSAKVTLVSVGPTTPVVLLAEKVNRAGAIIYNETGTLYIKYGTGVDGNTSYSRRLIVNDECTIDNYTGAITGIKASGVSNVLVTEIW